MTFGASRLSGMALAGAMAAVIFGATNAWAGAVADKAAEAERLLAEGKVDQAIEALDASADAFWKAAPLTFRKALFVDEATGFGEFKPRADAVFAPGAELKIYAEPVGFGWQDEAGAEKITFRTAIEIRDGKGLILARSSAPAVLEKTSRSKSRDFHITVTFTLPDLKPGDYRLVLTVTDAATGKSAPIELPITIAAP